MRFNYSFMNHVSVMSADSVSYVRYKIRGVETKCVSSTYNYMFFLSPVIFGFILEELDDVS